MGAWGYYPFENDDALDWLGDLAASKPWFPFRNRFRPVRLVVRKIELAAASGDWIEADSGCELLAACEVVIAAKNGSIPDALEECAAWIERASRSPRLPQIATDLVRSARNVLDAENSELRALWEESGEYFFWRKDVERQIEALTW